jgi:hypothetical protein
MVKVVNADAPVAREITAKSAPGNIQVLAPTAFKPVKDGLGDVYSAIVGNRNIEISPKDVRVVFPGGVTFKETISDRLDVSGWITNLPSGLAGHIHEASGGEKGAKEFRIFVSGIPLETRKEPVKVTIPGAFLNTGVDAVIEPNNDALIDIAEATITVADASAADAVPAAWTRSGKTVVIGGSVGSPIVPKTLTIRLVDASVPLAIPERTDLSRWITNLPGGLMALASETEKDAAEVVLTISGTPLEAIDQAVFVRIPAVELHRALDLVVEPNEDIRFEIYGLSIAGVIVGGAVKNPIKPVTVNISFGAGKLLNEIVKDTDLSKWFINLPTGLTAAAASATPAGAQEIAVIMGGIPAAHVNAPIKVRVPANVIYEGKSFDVAQNDNARYDVGSFDVLTRTREEENSLNKNWRGPENWQLNNPKLVDEKDFDPLGIVQITVQSVEEIGPQNDYFWNGDQITYGKLMAEARKIGAHAIINIVIDYEDVITENIAKRHVIDGYKLSADELAANRKSANRFTLEAGIDGSLSLIETTRRTVRTYTGTALAIKYK